MNSSLGDKMADWAVRQSEKLIKNLESRKSLFEYTKYMAQMLHQVMTGIREALKKLGIFQRPGKWDPKLKKMYFFQTKSMLHINSKVCFRKVLIFKASFIRNVAKSVRCNPRDVSGVNIRPFLEAAKIQKQLMIQSSATPTLLYMPSYEVLGYVLLAKQRYKQARGMFEASLEERMGRTLSLLGLARAHSMLGNTG